MVFWTIFFHFSLMKKIVILQAELNMNLFKYKRNEMY